jgi:GNAT superfamily N-acetyltransferase
VLLDWDSEHFGFPIGRVADDKLTEQRAKAIDDWCVDHGIRCLYFLADPVDAGTALVAASRGYRVVDVRVTVRHSMDGVQQLPATGPETMTIREASEGDLEDLRCLAARSHHGTRFYFDGRFPRERCDALYEAWVERGHRDPDRVLLAAVVDEEPVGYIVFSRLIAGGEGHGELAAVDARHRGKRIGLALHVHMLRLLSGWGAVRHRGELSLRNLAVIRLHERLGFLTDKVEVWHHKWYG